MADDIAKTEDESTMTNPSRGSPEHWVYKDLCDFFQQIISLKGHYMKALAAAVTPHTIDAEVAAVKVKNGFPLIDRSALRVDPAPMKHYFLALLAFIEVRKPQEAQAVKATISSPGVFETLIAQTLRQEAVVADHGEILRFLLEQTIQAVLEIYAAALQDHPELRRWSFGYCPICGAPPIIGMLEVEPKAKYLICGACTTRWRFVRSRCCHCGATGNVSYYMVEDDPSWRLETCAACNGYLKVIDQAHTSFEGPAIMAHLGSLHLDFIARRKGYRREDHF